MRIIISDHGRTRIKERICCSDRKIQKVAEKAWSSVEKITARNINRVYDAQRFDGTVEYRQLMGQVYVFGMKGSIALLMTVFPARSRNFTDKIPKPDL